MNKKTAVKTLMAGLVALTMCGTTMAAPRGGHGKTPAPARQHQTPARQPQKALAGHHATHGRNVAHHHAPVHHAPVHHAPVLRHHAPLLPPPPPPRPVVVHHHHAEANGWAVLGAALVGGIVGALAN